MPATGNCLACWSAAVTTGAAPSSIPLALSGRLAGLPAGDSDAAGIRGADAKDVYGSQMRPMAMTLADEAAVKNVVAYIQTLPVAKAKPTLDGDADQGKALYAVCATCHGQKAEGNLALHAPRLNIQEDWYLLRQLKNFKDGIRGRHPQDTYGAQMQAMSNTLPDEAAMKNVIAYIISLEN